MPGFVRSAVVAAGLFGLCALYTGTGTAAEDGMVVSVNTNMARVLRIDAPAATVIVGNPAVADVTIQDPQTLVLTGKSFGRTNLIILDAAGEPIADTLVEVTQLQSDTLTVFQGDQRTSLACAPQCQPTIALGDDPAFTSSVIGGSQMVTQAAR